MTDSWKVWASVVACYLKRQLDVQRSQPGAHKPNRSWPLIANATVWKGPACCIQCLVPTSRSNFWAQLINKQLLFVGWWSRTNKSRETNRGDWRAAGACWESEKKTCKSQSPGQIQKSKQIFKTKVSELRLGLVKTDLHQEPRVLIHKAYAGATVLIRLSTFRPEAFKGTMALGGATCLLLPVLLMPLPTALFFDPHDTQGQV